MLMKLKDFYAVNKYRLISFLILIVASLVVILLLAANQSTRDYFFTKYQGILRWRNDKLSDEIESMVREKYNQKEITKEQLYRVEEQITSIQEERESNDDFIETISYRELSDLLKSLVK